MKYTAQCKIEAPPEEGKPPSRPLQFALTLSMEDAEVRRLALRAEDVQPVLARALNLMATLLTPREPWMEKALDEKTFLHPQDTLLFLSQYNELFRVAVTDASQVEALREQGYRYLSDAYNSQGKLLPVFWRCSLIDMRDTEPKPPMDPVSEP